MKLGENGHGPAWGDLADAARGLAPLRDQGLVPTAVPELWIFRLDRSDRFTRAHSPVMNLSVAVSGFKRVRVSGVEETNHPSRCLILRGGLHYEAEVETSRDEPYLAIKLQLPPDIVGSVLLDLIDADFALAKAAAIAVPPLFAGDFSDDLFEPLMRIINLLGDPAARRIVAPMALREIAFRLLRSDAATSLRAALTRDHLRIIRILRTIDANPAEAPDLAGLAGRAAMSVSHFVHCFRQFSGMSPVQYVKTKRLEAARLRLLDTGAAIETIAAEAGYASTSHFSRDFKKRFGLPPGRYAALFHGGEAV